jgi:hypothetical protein
VKDWFQSVLSNGSTCTATTWLQPEVTAASVLQPSHGGDAPLVAMTRVVNPLVTAAAADVQAVDTWARRRRRDARRRGRGPTPARSSARRPPATVEVCRARSCPQAGMHLFLFLTKETAAAAVVERG